MDSVVSRSYNSEKTVVVCGGGLVGCLAACYFAKRNFNVELYEYRADVRKMMTVVGRSINMAISERGRDGLRNIGCEELITSKGIEMHSRMLHDIKGNMSAVPYDSKGRCILSIDRRYINELLLTEAEKYQNVKIFFSHKVKKCNTNSGQVTFYNTVKNIDVVKEFDLIIGCDGSFSEIRKSLLHDKLINYSQQYISSHYLELRMPPRKSDGDFALPVNYLHIWPRSDFMLIALPNQDKSFTCTLFMPVEKFEAIKSESELIDFFEKYFPDALDLIGRKDVIDTFFGVKPSPLISVKCNPHHGKKCVLLGDAAHSMVPFYGQGMNCGFEDCIVLLDLIDKIGFQNIDLVLENYSLERVPDTHAICDLALYNYVEMRHLVTKPGFKIRKIVDNILYSLFSNKWIPLYTMVTFTRIRYSEVVKRREKQDKILKKFRQISTIGLIAVAAFYLKRYNSAIQNFVLQNTQNFKKLNLTKMIELLGRIKLD